MRSKYSSFTFCKLLLIFSFLLFVPDVQVPNSTTEVLSKITKLEIADFVLNAPSNVKGSSSQKIKKSFETKFFTNVWNIDCSLVFQKLSFVESSSGILTSHSIAVRARAPPVA